MLRPRPDQATLAEVEVWRAAMQVDATDRRPTTGPRQVQKAAGLDTQLTGDHTPVITWFAKSAIPGPWRPRHQA